MLDLIGRGEKCIKLYSRKSVPTNAAENRNLTDRTPARYVARELFKMYIQNWSAFVVPGVLSKSFAKELKFDYNLFTNIIFFKI